MTSEICTHLSAYATQYAVVTGAYTECLAAADTLMSAGPGQGRADAAGSALAAWQAEDAKLKQMLVDLVAEGQVLVPKSMLPAPAGRPRRGLGGRTLVCAACRQRVPRLSYPEWRFAHNGVVTFRGEELALPEPAAC